MCDDMKFQDLKNGRFYNECCFDALKEIPDNVIDMILCDLPYGTTVCKWDSVLPFDRLWSEYWRVVKENGAVVLTAAFPFTAHLCMSQIEKFRYSLVWDKVNKYTGALNANKMPLRRHEDILIFYRKLPVYNKQFREGKPFTSKQTKGHGDHTNHGNTGTLHVTINNGNHNPCSIIQIKADNKLELGLHPTQKPIELFEYLIKTYSNENELILDNTAGSGTTAIAAINTNHKWICIESDEQYANIAVDRIKNHAAKR